MKKEYVVLMCVGVFIVLGMLFSFHYISERKCWRDKITALPVDGGYKIVSLGNLECQNPLQFIKNETPGLIELGKKNSEDLN